MTVARQKLLEGLSFGLVLTAALITFFLRSAALAPGVSLEQGESLTLAHALAEGLGLRWTPTSSPVAGPANLVWLMVQAALIRGGLRAEDWLPVVALGASLLAIALVGLRGAVVWRRAPRLEDALPAVGLSVMTALAEAAALGSGATSWVLALTVAALVLGRSWGSGSSRGTGALIGALVLFRPSAVWLFVASVPAWWVASKVEGRRAWRETLIFGLGGSLAIGLTVLTRVALFGEVPTDEVLPSTAGQALTVEFLQRQARWFWAALFGLTTAAVWRRFHLRGGATLLAWVLMTVTLATWAESPRSLFLGCVPLLSMLVGDGLTAARDEAAVPELERPLSRLAWLGFTGGVLLLVLAASGSYQLEPIMQRLTPVPARPELDAELGRRGVRQPLVVWRDGREGAELFPHARVVVLTSPDVAMEDLLLSEGPPELIDGRVSLSWVPSLAEHFERGEGGAWWLKGQSSDDDPRCPHGRLELLSSTPSMVLERLREDAEDEQLQRALGRWRCAVAGLEPSQLPDAEARAQLAGEVSVRAGTFEAQGRLELAVRAGSLASQLLDEDIRTRARTERLRRRWLGGKPTPQRVPASTD